MKRIYINLGIDDLEAVFSKNKTNESILEDLENELLHRKTKRAKKLLDVVERAIDSSGDDGGKPSQGGAFAASPLKKVVGKVEPSEGQLNDDLDVGLALDWDKEIEQHLSGVDHLAAVGGASRPIENKPEDLLDTWTVIEALSPQSYLKPNDLVIGKGSVADISARSLPWELGEKSRPRRKLFYTIYLGALDLGDATEDLLKVYKDEREEIPSVKGMAALAAIVVDNNGRPLGEDGIAISSFGWAYSRALMGKLDNLKHWGLAERKLLEYVEKIFDRRDSDDELLPVDWATIVRAYHWLVKSCGIPERVMTPPTFAIRRYQPFSKGKPEAPLLNSFYLNDLQRAKKFIHIGQGGIALRQYLGIDAPQDQIDLFDNDEALKKILEPVNTPLGRWPAQGRFPLVLLQQAAVNLAFRELKDGGIFSVNGPPGTGKTTLLRDIVASVVINRAIAMSAFDKPESAFSESGGVIRSRNAKVGLYAVDESLKGFELLVASSNNKAVENISKELPLIGAIAEDVDLSYFKPLCDSLLTEGDTSWGLIAAVLGNATNRNKFVNAAWWEEDTSLYKYFSYIAGSLDYEEDEHGNDIIPSIVKDGNPPEDIEAALDNWRDAREEFQQALADSYRVRDLSQDAFDSVQFLEFSLDRVVGLKRDIGFGEEEAEKIMEAVLAAEQNIALKNEKFSFLKNDRRIHNSRKLNFLKRLFAWADWKEWQYTDSRFAIDEKMQMAKIIELEESLLKLKDALSLKKKEVEKLNDEIRFLEKKKIDSAQKIDAARSFCDGKLVTDNFLSGSHTEKQLSNPVYTAEGHLYRDALFISAIKLHKSFIDAAYRPISQNLAAFMNILGNKKLPIDYRKLLPDIWATGCILCPVFSTTFASIDRMLSDFPAESIGWLLIDEAGQATPQQAVGAILRAKRVLAVGDPLQIEPVVTTPLPLLEGISKYMGVNYFDWVAPDSSVQALADRANSHGARITKGLSSLWIGSPLLVHRRCEDPMFTISNKLAYNGKMVKATEDKPTDIANVFGVKAGWFDVQGQGSDKWCATSGEFVAEKVLAAMNIADGELDLFIISPFKIVAQRMKDRLRNENLSLGGGGMKIPSGWIATNIGTVHAFQGKEAETVILLLGAPNPSQTGARNWAATSVNLLNVAVSRSKRNFYVVGNKQLWGEVGKMSLVGKEIRKYTRS